MNRNPKEKLARIEIRVKPKEKDKIRRIANKCNLSVSEYIVQRALGYEPKTVLPDVFFDFYDKLCQLCNTAGFTHETENKLLMLIDEIHSELLLPKKETVEHIKNGFEVELSGPPQSLLCGEKEKAGSGRAFRKAKRSKSNCTLTRGKRREYRVYRLRIFQCC